jgi:hypothetical protein
MPGLAPPQLLLLLTGCGAPRAQSPSPDPPGGPLLEAVAEALAPEGGNTTTAGTAGSGAGTGSSSGAGSGGWWGP